MRCHIGWTTAVRRVFRLEALHRSPGFDQCAIDREVIARQQPLDPRAAPEPHSKTSLRSRQPKVGRGFSKRSSGPTPHRRCPARQTSGTADRTPAAPSAGVPSAPSRTPATASPAAASRARSIADQDRNRALQNPATAPTKPRWSAIGSPEPDDRREPAPPDRHTKTTPPRARQIPASLPPVRYPQIRESRRRPKLYGFFNSLLEAGSTDGTSAQRPQAPCRDPLTDTGAIGAEPMAEHRGSTSAERNPRSSS